jgi:hypothetical protein
MIGLDEQAGGTLTLVALWINSISGSQRKGEAMRFGPGLLLLTLCSSVSSHAVAAEPNGCEHILGAGEYVPPSWPGRAILARQGNKTSERTASARRHLRARLVGSGDSPTPCRA